MKKLSRKWVILPGSLLLLLWTFPYFYTKPSLNHIAWWTGRGGPNLKGKDKQLPEDRVFPVMSDARGDAAKLLENTSYIKVDNSQLINYLGSIPQINGLNAYLVRGIALGSSGKFYALSDNIDIEVTYITFGRYPKIAKKWPIILLLKSKPNKVYCSYFLIE